MNAAHNGVYRMSPDIEDLVETSNNIAKVTVENGNIKIECLTRSSVESSKDDLANALTSVFELAGIRSETCWRLSRLGAKYGQPNFKGFG